MIPKFFREMTPDYSCGFIKEDRRIRCTIDFLTENKFLNLLERVKIKNDFSVIWPVLNLQIVIRILDWFVTIKNYWKQGYITNEKFRFWILTITKIIDID